MRGEEAGREQERVAGEEEAEQQAHSAKMIANSPIVPNDRIRSSGLSDRPSIGTL